ncbi:hypothetical protein RND81_10G216800 [Saponaria officinalis]|uniref:Photosynthetic NDH subcomplex B 4 n=1 Tax=Saponaria officinalis TaxID=3572 RepID=A0AAW1I4W5_SAPOF
MVESLMSFTLSKPCLHKSPLNFSNLDTTTTKLFRQISNYKLGYGLSHNIKRTENRLKVGVNALPDWPLMAVLVEHIPGQRDLITHKSIWHLSDLAIKKVYMFYIMFTVWGCCFFGAAKDPYYDSEAYRKDGGDGTGHWVYEKQEDIEESARAALWREELIEEIEQKVGGLRELEEAGRK